METSEQLSRLKVLIVEDDFINMEFLIEILGPYVAELFRATNGQEAIDMTLNQSLAIDLILMDIKMPFMDGFEATRLIREHGILIPVIAQTAYASDFDKKKINQAGFDGYLAKPIDESLLFQTILKVL
ncbi:response regulator [Natronoflexus pectinivorans]|uniref:CheY-like chemotaxis protein n=1 Tax=Natronoflexus pectinivorans TaxID=682526 RepID=A0A4R2GJJ1_9BACT|nr:response regulator [Natronoflexus pectinivorans]TCO08892.1 CheY-like chemotaxis protein [Natronoflexus pectinivorans]